jgi:DNA-binding transcriptional MerR regulator
MRISELSRTTGLTVATIKYYLRLDLIPAGTPITATQSEYSQVHVERLRLIRALVEVAGLPLTSVQAILATLDSEPTSVADAVNEVAGVLPPQYPPPDHPPQRALATMQWLGWSVDPDSVALTQLEQALVALESLGLTPTPNTLQIYADAARQVADTEISGGPKTSLREALHHAVIGSVMYEPILIALRRLAQQNAFIQGSAAATPEPEPESQPRPTATRPRSRPIRSTRPHR